MGLQWRSAGESRVRGAGEGWDWDCLERGPEGGCAALLLGWRWWWW